MSLRFTNNYQATIWAMIEWYHPGCPDGGDWEKAGWWQIEPGGSAVVYGGDLKDINPIWYYYAHASDGAYWAGPYEEIVPSTAFDWCSDTANTDSRTIGMRELDIGSDDYTLTFTP
jgi:uncharacterized membrane protein